MAGIAWKTTLSQANGAVKSECATEQNIANRETHLDEN